MRGLVRREPLRQLVELEAVRLRLALHDDADRVVAELDDDRVAVSGGPRDGERFRQVELELLSVDDNVHTGVMQRLKEAGAASCDAPKLARALGTFGSSAQPHLGGQSSIGDVVRASVSDGLRHLVAHDWRLRLGLPDPAAEDVHQARVAARRLRSNLKTFGRLLDPVWVKHVRSDLKWLGSALGALRDADVLAENLRAAPPQLLRELADERASAARQLQTVLGSEQYLNLLDRLHVATRTPPFALGSGDHGEEAAARRVLPALVGRRWRALRRQVRKSGPDPTDRDLHRIRIKAKQLRYAAEAAAPVVGKPAVRTASAAETVQTILGHHHDAVATETWLRQQATGLADSSDSVTKVAEIAFAAGALSADQHLCQRNYRRQWADSWKTFSTRKWRSWLE